MADRTSQTIIEVAARAAGVVTSSELRRAGVPNSTISDQLRGGFLVRVGQGVYEVPAMVNAQTSYHRAAKAHPRGMVAGRSAARLHSCPVPPCGPNEPIEVIVPAGTSARPKVTGVIVRSTRRWFAEDVCEVEPGLRVASPARTVVDLAGVAEISDRRLRHVVQTQVVERRVTLAEVSACLERVGGPGVPGSGRMGRLLAHLDDGQPLAESELERRLAPLLGSTFRRQYRPPWYDGVRGVVDFAEPVTRVIVEADGRSWHSTGQAMADDRRRDRLAARHGWVVVRVTWDDVVDRPEATAAEAFAVITARADPAPSIAA